MADGPLIKIISQIVQGQRKGRESLLLKTCLSKRFTDDNYAYISSGHGQAITLYREKAVENLLEQTGLAGTYTRQPVQTFNKDLES